jgi:hypothetical protein
VSRPRLPPHHHLSSRRLRRGCVSPCWPLPTHRSRLPRRVRSGLPLLPGTPPCAVTCTRAASTLRLAPIPAPRAAPLITPAPRVAPSTMPAPIPAPRATPSTTPVPRAAPSTPPAPRATPSTPTARFADLALVYHRRRHITTSAPADSGPSTSPVRFVTPPSSITAASRPRPQPLTSRQTAPSHRCTTRSPSTVTPGRPPDGDPAHRRHSSTCRPTDLGS